MSRVRSPPFEKMNELVEKRDERGLKLLFIFKNLQRGVTDRLREEYTYSSIRNNENKINKTCMSIAKEILDRNDDTPEEDNIRRVLTLLKNKYIQV